ncbi:MAG: D-hexose-6-phosphate mutarotase [Tetrasphaera sp.]|nr:D-hexose-6-phosphate mutarotase [Tetrasphaera sp.]
MSEGAITRHDVVTSTCTGSITDQGAQVISWAPQGAAPVLYVSSASRFQRGASIRAGAPICWPWFGPGRFPGLTPAHGFVRAAPWELVSIEETAAKVTTRHRLDSSMVTSAVWPHEYAAEVVASFGAELSIALTVTNTGSEDLDYEEAIHTYLAVGDVSEVLVAGLEGAPYIDKTTGGTRRVIDGLLAVTGETDAVCETTGPITVIDPVLRRRLVVTLEGAQNAVVWNPWKTKGDAIADVGDGEWRTFLCIEGANAFENAVRLAPGASHTLAYTVAVEPL